MNGCQLRELVAFTSLFLLYFRSCSQSLGKDAGSSSGRDKIGDDLNSTDLADLCRLVQKSIHMLEINIKGT